jgi:hypothetical protein
MALPKRKGDIEPQTYRKMMEAMDYRLRGWTYEAIAGVMGISLPYASKLVKTAIKTTVHEKAEQIRAMELKRLDKMFAHAYEAVLTTPEAPGVVNKDAVEVALKIMKRKAELLGLDMPTRIEAKVDANVTEQVQFYIPSNGREEVPITPADVVQPAVPALAFESPAYDEDEDDE